MHLAIQFSILDREDWTVAESILTNADVVIVSVPINLTLETIERLKPYLTENMLLADLTSVKREPLAKMLEIHTGAVLGLHPMFGPDIASMAKQVVVRCDGRFPERYEWLLEQIQIWGAKNLSNRCHRTRSQYDLYTSFTPFFNFCEWLTPFQTAR